VVYGWVGDMMGRPWQLLVHMRWAGLAGLLKLGLSGLYRWVVIQGTRARASGKQGQGRFLLYRRQSVCLQH
jgi:hypothetical protein